MTDQFTFAGEGAGEVINIGKDLVAGAIIHGVIIHNADLGANVDLDIGDSDDPNRYIAAYDANANESNQGAVSAITGELQLAGVHYVIGTNAGDETIIVTTASAAATGLLKVTILYSED